MLSSLRRSSRLRDLRAPLVLAAALLAASCGVDRTGLGFADGGARDTGPRPDSGAGCPPGEVDLDGDGICECVIGGEADICDGIDNDCDPSSPDGSEDPSLGTSCDGSDSDFCEDGVSACSESGAIFCDEPGDTLEVCDDAMGDEDCDGTIDEGCACIGDETRPCGTDEGACERGTQRCVDGTFSGCEGGTGPADETCDGVDEDCDGTVDEGLTRACANDCGTGGVETCDAGSWVGCSAPPEPAERCNDVDDDCDGSTDEALSRSCANRCGDTGTEMCAAGAWVGCTAPPEPAETCNDVDDDCDGTTDEALSRSCANRCGDTGTEMCAAGAWVGCDAPPEPAETCNDMDDDCDGSTDEALSRSCANLCGDTGTEMCAAGAWVGCDAPPEPAETCNDVDDDCDGTTDEGLSRSCANACGDTGTEMCAAGAWVGCTAPPEPMETCNTMDDDCDGATDEGGVCGADCTVVDLGAVQYLFCTNALGWSAAQTYCTERGYDLVRINSSTEQTAVWTVAEGLSSSDWWIGLYDDGDDWRWIATGELAPPSGGGFDDWESGEPNGSDTCGRMKNSAGGQWADRGCGTAQPFICASAP
ncbi:MAG TPA: C-type lectin domain-containing protein [Polyangiaceae bacterium LLY-WYZ-15_(1-7)]|nr:C-type lectin domain-containing protein [Polyangiaceae bacterium LLY-WYZ-15_(1-7)]HJL07038.1 C-type lectin domain-containing protein [Polyangiaceae bacterium LLY-WYZ-15_(1-7)]